MSADIKRRMLKAICHKPCALRTFTEGSVIMALPIRHIEKFAADMVAEGLIFEREESFHATDQGRQANERAPSMAQPRVWCAASTSGTYKPPAWSVRSGGADHLQHRSRGV